MVQYFEEMDNYMRENQILKTHTDLVEEDRWKEENRGILNFNQETDNGCQLFTQKISFTSPDHMAASGRKPDAAMRNDEEIKSDVPDLLQPLDHYEERTSQDQVEKSTSSKEDELTSKRKSKISDKERARRARQRKKKYYEDLEKRCENLETAYHKLTKELEYCKHKLSIYENNSDANLNKGFQDLEKQFFERVIDFIEKSDNAVNCVETFKKIGKSYGAFGEEKVKILDNCINMFLENAFSGSMIKQDLYILDKKFPTTFAEKESFMKMKKFQQFEKYPDEFVRDWVLQRELVLKKKEQFNNEILNAIPVLTDIKKGMEDGLKCLFEGRDLIYRALMKYDVLHSLYEGRILPRNYTINLMKEVKQSSFTISYKDVFGIQENKIEVEEDIEIPNQKALKKLRVNAFKMDPKLPIPTNLSGTFKYTHMRLVR
ncbi:unnamed protein product [Moneuplotes crassus]|uniref:BZIP domain-containing protein n=1 Tax=Euplotes crassus TaxID=5936 RepID=A0AAD1X6R0_EUPCR|nr:unnamed protein product [Moneuplotes crassus]